MGRPPATPRVAPADSIRRQAGLRLAAVMLLAAAGILAIGLSSFYSRQVREVAQKQEVLRAHFAALLPRIEAAWRSQAGRLGARIEFLRLGGAGEGWGRLDALLDAEGSAAAYADMLVLDAEGRMLFARGAEAHRPADPVRALADGWHYAAKPGGLFRVIGVPMALGATGSGRLVLLHRVDGADLVELAVPETHLHLHVFGREVAGSHGGAPAVAGRTGLLEDGAQEVIQVDMPWATGAAVTPLLIIHREFRDSFPLPQFLLRPMGAIALTVGLLWLGLGLWLRRTARRIGSLEAAARLYQAGGHAVPASRSLAPARAADDEIGRVADALAALMSSVEARDREQQGYLDTLALLDEAVLELDDGGVVLRASPGWQRLSRRTEVIVGRPFAAFVDDDDAEAFGQLCRAFACREKDQAQLRLRLQSRPPGHAQWVECRFVVRLDDGGRPAGIRGVLRDVTQTYLHEKQISHMALHDALTELPNRILLEDRLKVALRLAARGRQRVGVCFIDLDHFKNVNDNLGHKAGDKLLVAFARAVRLLVREGDTLARWGGDEFVLLLPEVQTPADLREVLRKVADAFRQPVRVDDAEFVITFSMGVALYPDDGQDVETLLSQADRAMFYAKAQGRNQICLFGDIGTKGSGRQELYLQHKLAEAVAKGRIVTWFQPIIDARSGACTAVEVLARWHDADHGWVSPATFIPIAENIGVIRDLGHQVWLQALEAGRAWRQQGHRLRIAVNISKRQLFLPRLTEQLLGDLARNGLSPDDVLLEVTESVATLDVANTAEQLNSLHVAGFHIAIDDFGTGYSSLSQLHDMPVQELKIDISFVRRVHEPAGRSLVQAIVQLARALDLRTVAEGIEDATTAGTLRQLGVDALQGYHFARPMPREEFGLWLAQGTGLARPVEEWAIGLTPMGKM